MPESFAQKCDSVGCWFLASNDLDLCMFASMIAALQLWMSVCHQQNVFDQYV